MDSLLQYDSDLSQRLSQTICYPDPNNNDGCDSSPTATSPKGDKYSLRPRSLRQQENEQDSTAKSTKTRKPKQKPPPLSKYRRKTANARERSRMREINQAFETLRQAVPLQMAVATPTTNEKLTKITTLRLAMQYIATLSATLNSYDGDNDNPISLFADYSDLDFLLESDGESLPLSDHSLLTSSPDFPETSLSPVDFGDPSLLHTDFTDHALDESDFSDFLLT